MINKRKINIFIALLFVTSLIFPRSNMAQEVSGEAETLNIDNLNITLSYPGGWSTTREANLYGLINADKTAEIMIYTEQIKDHNAAVSRLKEIEAESDSPSTFLNIGGWPALQRRHLAPKPQPGQGISIVGNGEMMLEITTAVAAGDLLIRLQGRLLPDASQALIDEVETIGKSLVFPTRGDPLQVNQEILNLSSNPRLKSWVPVPLLNVQKSAAVVSTDFMQTPGAGALSLGLPGLSVRAGTQASELEITASNNAQNLVIGSNGGYFYSNDGGQTFNASAGIPSNDPSLAVGLSGTFYAANISAPSTGFWVSIDNGRTFTFRANAFTCQGTPPSCGGFPFPDQEHIGADRFNAGSGGDRVYSAWRHGGGSYGIVCSSDGGTNWGAPVFRAGDFPRIVVNQNSIVYVVYRSGNNIMLDRFNACDNNNNISFIGSATPAAGISDVTCPVPGLDRCNTGNLLSSHMVAIDDTNPNHVFIAYAVNTAAGSNENVLVRDSIDGGATWPAARVVQVNTAIPARRFMPWVCSTGGTAFVSWYDRRASTPCATPPCAANNDLTDFFAGTASLDIGGNLVAGTEFKISEVSDPECASGWACVPRSLNDSQSCSVQPQLAGACCLPGGTSQNPCPAGSTGTRCDPDTTTCSAGESCIAFPLGGCPKYGDYNGNACMAGRFLATWASATSPPRIQPPSNSIDIFFYSLLSGVPQIQIPGVVLMPDTCLGSTSTMPLNVCNTGDINLEIGPPPIATSDIQFAVTTPTGGYPVVISPNSCFPFQVRFSPISTGTATTTLTIVSNDPVNPTVTVQAQGNGIQQNISTMIADNGDFGDVCLGSYKDLDLSINNSGGCDLSVTNIQSSSPSEFQPANVLTYPLTIHAGDTIQVPIRLKPTSLGPKTANITISSNDPDTPSKVVAVSGNTPPGDIRVTGSTDFGDVCAGTQAEKTVSVCNVGQCNLNITSAAFNPPCADFTLINSPFPAAVSPDSCNDVVIRFTPTSAGPKTCTLTITSDDPDTPVTSLTVTANTPLASIDVPPDLGFSPEVIQNIGMCQSLKPFPISNTGSCDLNIMNISIGGVNSGDYALSGLPSFPIILEPGHVAGEGNLNTVFAPTAVDRDRLGDITVTYVSDPITGATTNVTRELCGEGVFTGARVLVTAAGVPLPMVEKIQIQRITGNRNKKIVDTVDVAKDLPLQTEAPSAPCASFQYHREYGTVSNQIQLLPGSYRVTATAVVNGKRRSKTVGFDVSTCDFNPNIVVDF